MYLKSRRAERGWSLTCPFTRTFKLRAATLQARDRASASLILNRTMSAYWCGGWDCLSPLLIVYQRSPLSSVPPRAGHAYPFWTSGYPFQPFKPLYSLLFFSMYTLGVTSFFKETKSHAKRKAHIACTQQKEVRT